MGNLQPIMASIRPHDAAEFASLPQEIKDYVLDMLGIIRDASLCERPRLRLAEAAALNCHKGRGWSLKAIERKFYALRNTRDWRCLIDRAKTSGGRKRKWLTPAVIDAWRGYCDQHKCSLKTAWLHIVAAYRSGKAIGDVDWRMVWESHPDLMGQPMPALCPPKMPIPEGWSYYNLMRHKPTSIEQAYARKGVHAAMKLSSRVHTTRADLPVGAQYEFDDMWHNCLVQRPGYPKLVRPLELACIDVSSAHKVAFGLKPRLEDENGKRENIKEADMRYLVAHVLCNIGFHRDGCLLLVEGGTAAIKKSLATALKELSGGLVEVSTSGVDRRVPIDKWGYETKGNADHKAHIESWHNLAQNRLDNLPAFVGRNSRLDKPEDHEALLKVVNKLLAAQCTLPDHLRDKLVFPVLDWSTFSEVVHEVYAQIGHSNDHQLEGWDGRTERQWKCHAADWWHSECEFLRIPAEAQTAIAPLIQQDGFHRIAKMSRRQWWDQGQSELVRLPDWAVTVICGVDLAEARPCPVAEVCFVNKEIDPAPMIYRLATCVNADGEKVALREGWMYRWMINPFDPRVVFVMEVTGKYVGKCLRIDAIDRQDIKAISEEWKATRNELSAAIAPVQRRATAAAKAAISSMSKNASLLRQAQHEEGERLLEESTDQAARRAAIRGVSLDDLMPEQGAEESGEVPNLEQLT